jgi:hypothetical protein
MSPTSEFLRALTSVAWILVGHAWWPLLGIAIAIVVGRFSRRQSRVEIYRAPGWSLRRLAVFVFSNKVYSLVFKPTLADLEKEYLEALAEERKHKARWVVVRGYWSFWTAFVAQLPISSLRLLIEAWKASKLG